MISSKDISFFAIIQTGKERLQRISFTTDHTATCLIINDNTMRFIKNQNDD